MFMISFIFYQIQTYYVGELIDLVYVLVGNEHEIVWVEEYGELMHGMYFKI